MLHSLHIENYILIDSLDVTFPEGLVIITGQTGAGKSILLGALSLLSGAKADAASVAAEKKHAPDEKRVSASGLLSAAGSLADEAVIAIAEENGAVTLSLLSDGAILTATGDAADFAPLFRRPVVCHDAKKLFHILFVL